MIKIDIFIIVDRTFKMYKLNVWTWNVNSIRTKVNLVKLLLGKYDIDILLITETKIQQIHEKDIAIPGYKVIFNSNKNSYHHGVCIFYKDNLKVDYLGGTLPTSSKPRIIMVNQKNAKAILAIKHETLVSDVTKAHNTEGRILSLLVKINGKNIILVGTYVPNSGVNRNDPLKRLAYRTVYWDRDIYSYLLELEKVYKNVIWFGDLNVARFDNDMYKKELNYAGTTPEERSNFNDFLIKSNWIDTWDTLNPSITNHRNRCTYGVDTNCKLRLDYVLCSSQLKENIKTSVVDQGFEGSDHVPIGTLFQF